MDEWSQTYSDLLAQLQQRHLLISERVAQDTATLFELKTTKENIDINISNLQKSIDEGQRSLHQVGQTLESAKRGYTKMLESAQALLELTRNSVPEQALRKQVVRKQPSQNAIEARLFRPQGINGMAIQNQQYAPQQGVILKKTDIDNYPPSAKLENPTIQKRQFQWYDEEYYAQNTSIGAR